VWDDDPGKLGALSGNAVDGGRQFEPFRRADCRLPTLRKGTGTISATLAISG
jgi:hypothetical protein